MRCPEVWCQSTLPTIMGLLSSDEWNGKLLTHCISSLNACNLFTRLIAIPQIWSKWFHRNQSAPSNITNTYPIAAKSEAGSMNLLMARKMMISNICYAHGCASWPLSCTLDSSSRPPDTPRCWPADINIPFLLPSGTLAFPLCSIVESVFFSWLCSVVFLDTKFFPELCVCD